jgi:hypothetical protein
MDVGAHELTRTIDCQIPGCEHEAEPGALVCRYHAERQTVGTAGKRCRIVGCESGASGNYARGLLANLCWEHERDARREASERASRSGRSGRGVPHVTVQPSNDSFAAKAKALVPVGRRLDTAIARKEREMQGVRVQRARLQTQEATLDQDIAAALREWRSLVQQLAG